MSAAPRFSYEAAVRLLGPAAIEEARRRATEAPPLGPELREHIRAVFASAPK